MLHDESDELPRPCCDDRPELFEYIEEISILNSLDSL
jgi:hypothetical protein